MSMPRIADACCAGLLLVGGDLDAAELAASADLHLGLDGTGVTDLVGGRDRVVARCRRQPLGTGMPWRANSCLPWYSRRSIGARTIVEPLRPGARRAQEGVRARS